MRREGARRDAVDAHRHVVIDERQQLVDRSRTDLYKRVDHFFLARQAVRDQAAQLPLRRADQIAVARRDDGDVLVEQLVERLQIGAHVAVGRIDHHGRALHDVIARE